MMSRIGVPSIRSAQDTSSTSPSFGSRSTPSSRTDESPIGFGRKGERVANTPSRVLPPSRGGRTVGDQPFDSEKFQISHRWVNCSMPRSAFSSRYYGSNTMRDFNSCTSPLWRGMPNFVGKSL